MLKRDSHLLLFLVVLIMPLAGFGTDIFTPSLPIISTALHASSNSTKQAIAIFILGFGLAQILTGPLADRYGRKPVLLICLAIYCVSNLLCAFSTNISTFLLLRFIQGTAMAGLVLNVRSIIADCYHGDRLRKAAIYATTAWGVSPVIGPGIGGYLQVLFDWQANFYFLFGFALIMFILVACFLPETHSNKIEIKIKSMVANYKRTLKNLSFLRNIFGLMLGYAILNTFNVAGPFVVQHHFNMSVLFYSHYALVIGIFFFIGSISNRFLIKQLSSDDVIFISIVFILIVSVVSGLLTLVINNVYLLMVTAMFIGFAIGMLYPNCSANCTSMFKDIAGTAASARGVVSMTGSAILLAIIGHFSIDSLMIYFSIYFVLSFVLLFIWQILS